MANSPEIRLITKVARLYHEQKFTQTKIGKRLGISQVTVSRLLKRAEEYDIVKITVTSPPGAFLDLEEQIEKKFNLLQVIIGDAARDSEEQILSAIGSAAAHFLETTVTSGDVIGVSSWSASLLSMVEQMHPIRKLEHCKVVQILGGLGNPSAEKHANHLVKRLARLVDGEALFLPAPGILGAANSVKVLLRDPYIKGIYNMFGSITVALVGIGSVEPSSLVASSGNVFGANELAEIRRRGAVGDICLRFYGEDGVEISDPAGTRVIGLDLETLRNIPRAVGIAGGKRKVSAILGALRGKHINLLVTDQYTAERLIRQSM